METTPGASVAAGILDGSMVLDVTGSIGALRLPVEAPEEARQRTTAKVDRADRAGTLNTIFPSLYFLAEQLAGDAPHEPTVHEALLQTTPSQARDLGAVALANGALRFLNTVPDTVLNGVEDELITRSREWVGDDHPEECQVEHRLGDEGVDVASAGRMIRQTARSVVEPIVDQARKAPLREAARDAEEFWETSQAAVGAYGRVTADGLDQLPTSNNGEFLSYEAIMEGLDPFTRAVVEGVRLQEVNGPETSPLQNYRQGITRAAAYTALLPSEI